MTQLLTPEELLLQAGELYSLPAIAMELLALADDPTLQPNALKRCFERDPALTAKVLRVVNSSLFGLPHPISDLNQAITLLGLKPLKLLVLGFSVPPALTTGIEADDAPGLLEEHADQSGDRPRSGRTLAAGLGR